MKIEMISVVIGVIALLVGGAIGAALRKKIGEAKLSAAKQSAAQIIEDAKKNAEMQRKEAETGRKEAEIQAKDTVFQAKAEWEIEAKELRRELQSQERRLQQKEENIDRRSGQVENRENELVNRDRNLSKKEEAQRSKEQEIDVIIEKQKAEFERISGMSPQEAKEELIQAMESEAKHDAAKRIKVIEEEAHEIAEKESKKIICLAVQRYAGDYVAERTVSVIPLPSDELKGRIIGREGRNIRALEAATGIDLIIDDTPEAVIISGFNPVRREVAKLSLEKLIADGRIHPSRIEEVVKKSEEEVNKAIRDAGEQATFDIGVHGIHPEIIKLIGRLKYRTSYSQNVLQHSIEVAFLCGAMAAELGINVKQAKRAGLLHDIGKAVDHEIEGSHAVIGADMARKYGESPEIVHAIGAHHEDEKPETVLAILTQAADALSGARPGARREMLESYVKRLQDLEKIGKSFEGVTSCFAIQAGREIRVMVNSGSVSDEHSHVLARDMAKKIEAEMTYPGQIKVNVIRETRATGYAK